uniref:Uncharacterized protein n=1 Tax=Arundo donax TaxID=35708 RepID=A0A0A8ZGF2_ARUDO
MIAFENLNMHGKRKQRLHIHINFSFLLRPRLLRGSPSFFLFSLL